MKIRVHELILYRNFAERIFYDMADVANNYSSEDCDREVLVDKLYPVSYTHLIGIGDAELSARCCRTGEEQSAELFQCHRLKIQQNIRKNGNAGKCGKEEDDKRSPLSAKSEITHRRIAVSYTHLDVYKRQPH